MLGPQRLAPTLRDAVAAVGAEGTRVAVVTAGWEERESEDAELTEHLAGETLNLRLFERAEDVFARDPALFTALRARHDRIRKLQSLYHLRLAHAMEAARELLALPADGSNEEVVEIERDSAIEAIRTLDQHHLELTREVHAAFDEEWRPDEHDAVRHHHDELRGLLQDCGCLCIAGGHVAILLNRLRLFGFARLADELPLVCWSAGAMAMSERVILFHDSPPQGAGNAEVLEPGLGLLPGLVALPHAAKRLRLSDPVRV